MRKLFSSGFFGLAILCFCLPWVTVSCQQQKISTFTGIQMVMGTEVAEPGSGMFGGPTKKKQVEPNALAVVAVVTAVAAFFISLIAGGASTVPAVIGVLVAFALKSNIDQDIVKHGQGLLNVTYESGFWAYVLLLICGSLSNLIPSGTASEISQNCSYPTDNLKKCPMCAEPINFEALVCKHCGNKFDESDVKIAIEQKRKLQTAHYCPRCDMTYPIEKTVCDVCRMQLIKTDSSVNKQDLAEEKTCPMCAETVKAAARICKHCRHDFENIEEKPVEAISPPIMADEDSVKQPLLDKIDTYVVEVQSSNNDYGVQLPSSPPSSKNNTLRYIAGSAIIIVIIVVFGYLYKFIALPNKILSNKTSPAFAGQNNPPLNNDEKMNIFNELLSKCSAEYQKETRNEFAGSVDKYLDISPIKLSKNKQTFLVTGNALPFVGASKSFCWVYEKSGNIMRQIADLELCENIKPSKSMHNGYADIHDLMHSGAAGTLYKTIYQFNGSKYQEKRSR